MNITVKKKKHEFGIERSFELTEVVGDKITVHTDYIEKINRGKGDYRFHVLDSRFYEGDPHVEFQAKYEWVEYPTDEQIVEKTEEFHKKAVAIASKFFE
jgi:hypothetical protein